MTNQANTTSASTSNLDMMGSNQWAKRPADERFWNLEEMYEASTKYFEGSYEDEMPLDDFARAIEGDDKDGVTLEHEEHGRLRMTNWSFGQLCRGVQAPQDFISTLSPSLAAEVLRERYAGGYTDEDSRMTNRQLYLGLPKDEDGHATVRAITSERYQRVPNYQVIGKLMELPQHGWVVPPARPAGIDGERTRIATEADVIDWGVDSPLTIKEGDEIAPAGLYVSDRDMFAFLVNPERRIDDGTDEGLSRGFFIRQSEVGASSLAVGSFLMRYVCGNHIVWGMKEGRDVKLRHTGNINEVWGDVIDQLTRFEEGAASEEESVIREARERILGDDLDEIQQVLYRNKRIKGLTKGLINRAYAATEEHSDTDGDPRSLWGMVQGITRVSQQAEFAQQRQRIDAVAGQLMQAVLN